MPKYKTQTNDLTEVIETGSGGSGGLTYETVDLGYIDTGTVSFDTAPAASKEKIVNILQNKKIIYISVKVNNKYISGCPFISVAGSQFNSILYSGNTIAFTMLGTNINDLMISIDQTLTDLIVANTNYTLEIAYDN